MNAPDYVDPLIGYRHWRILDGELCSPFLTHRWARGVNTASCHCESDHADPPPGHMCACGLHAWYRPCPRLGYATPGLVAGAIAMWGDIELHETGLRAQYATVVALVQPMSHTVKRRRLEEIAEELEVEVVTARRLTGAALNHGLPAPACAIP